MSLVYLAEWTLRLINNVDLPYTSTDRFCPTHCPTDYYLFIYLFLFLYFSFETHI